MKKYETNKKGKGWHGDKKRHSNAKKYGSAGKGNRKEAGKNELKTQYSGRYQPGDKVLVLKPGNTRPSKGVVIGKYERGNHAYLVRHGGVKKQYSGIRMAPRK